MKLAVSSALLVESYNFSSVECTSVNSGKLAGAKIYAVPEGLLVEYRKSHLIPYANVKGMTLESTYEQQVSNAPTAPSQVISGSTGPDSQRDAASSSGRPSGESRSNGSKSSNKA